MKYAVGDFMVTVCTLMSRNNVPRGLVIEVQYTACYTASSVETFFDEFFTLLIPPENIRKPVENLSLLFEKAGLLKDYGLKHTAIQYVAAFNILRKFDK